MSMRDEKAHPNVYGKQLGPEPTGGQRLKQTLNAIRQHSPMAKGRDNRPELLSYDWARNIDVKVESHERQLKLLNATMISALIADIAIRLLKP